MYKLYTFESSNYLNRGTSHLFPTDLKVLEGPTTFEIHLKTNIFRWKIIKENTLMFLLNHCLYLHLNNNWIAIFSILHLFSVSTSKPANR